MKKIIIAGLLVTCLGSFVQGQAVYQGKIVGDVYFGGPNWINLLIRAAYTDIDPNISETTLGVGPLGIRGEYLVADKVGIGLDILYVKSGVEYSFQTEAYNNITQSWQSITYDYEISRTKLSLIPTFSFHFGNSESFDGYFSVGAGYASKKWTFKSNDPDFMNESLGGVIPFEFRIAVGGRYFFTENIGIHFAMGVSGPLLSGGLSVRL